MFLGYQKLTQQHLSIFDKYYYPLPMYFLSATEYHSDADYNSRWLGVVVVVVVVAGY